MAVRWEPASLLALRATDGLDGRVLYLFRKIGIGKEDGMDIEIFEKLTVQTVRTVQPLYPWGFRADGHLSTRPSGRRPGRPGATS